MFEVEMLFTALGVAVAASLPLIKHFKGVAKKTIEIERLNEVNKEKIKALHSSIDDDDYLKSLLVKFNKPHDLDDLQLELHLNWKLQLEQKQRLKELELEIALAMERVRQFHDLERVQAARLRVNYNGVQSSKVGRNRFFHKSNDSEDSHLSIGAIEERVG